MTEEYEAEIEAEEEIPQDVAEDVDSDPAPEEETNTPDPDLIAEARKQGWKSRDEWHGSIPRGYIEDPEEYLEYTERLSRSPVVKAAMERAERAEELARKTEAALQAGHKRDMERQKAEYEARMQALDSRRRQAAEEADVETYDKIGRAMAELPKPVDPTPQADPLEPFYQGHSWLKDPILAGVAKTIVDQGLRSGAVTPDDAGKQIEFAEQGLKEYFPHKFAPPAKEPPKPRVSGGGMAPTARKTGFDTLPKEARDVFSRQVKQGIFEDTKEDREFYFNEYQNG